MLRTDLVDAYFDYLIEQIEIYEGFQSLSETYNWVLLELFRTEFIFKDERHSKTGSYDQDRAKEGLYLRKLFAESFEISEDFWVGLMDDSSSILEMMIALAIRMDADYLYDPKFGDRKAQWFWNMFESLGLMDYDNDNYSKFEVENILKRFNKKEYSANGMGSLFSFSDDRIDARSMDIWTQMTRWIDSII